MKHLYTCQQCQYVNCFGQELHKTADRWRCTGTYQVGGMKFKNSHGGWCDRAMVGLEKLLLLEMFSESRES